MNKKSKKKRFLRFLGNRFIVPLVNVLCKTLRITEINRPNPDHKNGIMANFIFAFWHGTMLAPWYCLKGFYPTTIISQSKDGELLAKLLNKWNYNVKRGSSSRDGKIVLNELIESAKNKNSIAITPDGPKGPKKIMKAGTVVTAKKSQIPIVLIGIYYQRKIKLKSWDRFEIPLFFSKVKMIYSNPILLKADLTYEETDEFIKQMTAELNKYQAEAKTSW